MSNNDKHLFDPNMQGLVQKAAVGMRMVNDIDGMKEMSHVCIVARNDAIHFTNLKQLEDMVKSCKKGMKIFP